MENGENNEKPKQQEGEIRVKASSLRRLAFEEKLRNSPELQALRDALEADEKGKKLEDSLT